MRTIVAAALGAVLLIGAGCARTGFQLEGGAVHRGDIEVAVGTVGVGPQARLLGAVRLRAGNVEVGEGSEVTGPITIDHGNVDLGGRVRSGGIKVASGTVRIGPEAIVAGPLELASGLIALQGATVEQPVTLVRGRLEVGAGSVLARGLVVRNPGKLEQDSTYVVIAEGAHVSGPIRTEGLVRLIVAPGADVAGASFQGRQPEGW